ncbi:2694_t:CDS:2 [Funneliformis caledonium]|uniref:2694_t:CDS:1 n=1 Tax=Funneliformis caledonium TaxID=1117310 RepID=A0A9N9HET7_9GLOM|nr:2694_t:CDS:2 [Funneliformis caledonium]
MGRNVLDTMKMRKEFGLSLKMIVRKQKIPELKINHLGITQYCIDVAPNKELFDRILSITGNNFSNEINESSRYRVSFAYSYPSEQHEKDDNWTYMDFELSTSKFPDKKILKCILMISRKELKKIERVENDYGKYPFKTFYPLRRRPLRDIYPETVDQWKLREEAYLEQHQIRNGRLSLMIRNFTLRYKSSVIYIISWWKGDGKGGNDLNKDENKI